MKHLYLTLLFCLCLLTACQQRAELPAQFTESRRQADIYPDYKAITVPPNIAPLNFRVNDKEAEAFVVAIEGKQGNPLLSAAGQEAIITLDETAWSQLLSANKGDEITVTIYAQHKQGWLRYQPHTLKVAEEEIDPYLSYRLIEPGYDIYRQLGLYQRDLTSFEEKPIYENNRNYEEENNHCVNCHNYQNYSTKNMLFHVRSNHGGTLLVRDGKAQKIAIKDPSILTSGVYPSWHPTRNLVAFSTNKTGQVFHLYHDEKIEVMDEGSDLLLYDADNNEISHIVRTKDYLETFPCWGADGKSLYYCAADVSPLANLPDSLASRWIVQHWDSLLYNVMRMDFDPETRTFSPPQLVVDAASTQHSISVPRMSPDGRYLLYTQGDYGQFHIWHKSSDQWVLDLQSNESYPLKEANSNDVDSYHTWSSNGRWIVFSSRRMDGNYTRLFITYFDKTGHAHKAFCLPQRDPQHNVFLLKSYNVPELTRDAVRSTPEELKRVIYETDQALAKYVSDER